MHWSKLAKATAARDQLNKEIDEGYYEPRMTKEGKVYLARTDKGALAGRPPSASQLNK